MSDHPIGGNAEPVPHARVLLVEDDPDVASVVGDILSARGHEVEHARDSRSGLCILDRFGPGLVICDFGLPDGDCFAVAQAARNAGAVVLVITGYLGKAEELQARGWSAIGKPFLLEEFEKAVDTLLRP